MLSSPKSIQAMSFDAAGYTVSGAALTVTSRIAANASATIASNLVLGAGGQQFYAAPGATLTLNGVISGDTAHVGMTGRIVLGGASTYIGATVLDGAELNLLPGASIGGTSITVRNSTFINNGTVNANVGVLAGGLAKGSGVFNGSIRVFDGGVFSPGNSPGAVTTIGANFDKAGVYGFEIVDAAGTSGMAFDRWDVATTLKVTAGTAPTKQFVIALASLDATGNAAPAMGFDADSPGQWLLLHADGGITTYDADGEITPFDPSVFTVDTSAFLNPLNGGTFSVAQSGNDLLLTFTPVPEPSTAAAAAALAGVGLLAARTRRSRCSG